MKLNYFSASLFISSILAGCYGTKVGPPVHSPTPPPGIGPAQNLPDDFTVPPSLQGALTFYHQRLVAQSHHLSPDAAEKYANAEISSLKKQYQGRDAELRSEIVQRVKRMPVEPRPRAGQSTTTGYPSDTTTN